MQREKTKKSKEAKRRITIESFVVLFIVMTPFLAKVYEFFPTEKVMVIEFLGLEIKENGWGEVQWRMWFMTQKVLPLYLLFIWFMTCKHWWYHIILIPLIMYVFQIFEDLFDQDGYVDTENLLWLLPICIVIIPFVYFIRVKLYDKHVHGIDLDAMDAELRILKEKELLRKEREKLEQRKKSLSKKM